MLKIEIFVGEGPCAVDSGATRTIAIEKIPTLNHEVFDLKIVT